jgi:hypothetical protein
MSDIIDLIFTKVDSQIQIIEKQQNNNSPDNRSDEKINRQEFDTPLENIMITPKHDDVEVEINQI